MAWRDLAIVGVMKKFLGHKDTPKEHIVVQRVKVKKTVVPEPVTGAVVVKKEYSVVTTVVETPPVEELVPETVKEGATAKSAPQKEAEEIKTDKGVVTPQKAVAQPSDLQEAAKPAQTKESKVEAKTKEVVKDTIKEEKTVAKATAKETLVKKEEKAEVAPKESEKVVAKTQESQKEMPKSAAPKEPEVTPAKKEEPAAKKPEVQKVSKETPKSEPKPQEKVESEKSAPKESAEAKEPAKSVKEAATTTQSVKTTAKKSTTAASKKSGTAKAPSKRAQKLELYHNDIMKHLGEVDDKFLEIIVKNLGPSIYNKDAETVACSDPKELETVKNNFLVRKLKMPKNDKEALDKAVAEVCEKLKGVKNKYRATFYYMLAKNLKRESRLR